MKSPCVSELIDGQLVATLFLVREKEIRISARSGKSWLELSLGDRTGSIPAKMWDNFEAIAATFERDDVVRIRGRVKLYNGSKELTLEQIIPAAGHEYELGDFLPHTKCDVEKLYADLRAAIAGMKNPWLQKLLASVVDDPEMAPRLKRAPAAMTMHHAYLGGLLEHIVSLMGLAKAVSAHYPELDADLLLAGVVLHDIGKIEELRYTRGIDYSDAGRLLGHITIGAGIVREKIRAIPGFPAAARGSGGAFDSEPSRHVRIRFAVAAAASRGRSAEFHRRHGFENGGDAQDAGAGFVGRAGRPLDRPQSFLAPRSASQGSVSGRRRAERRRKKDNGSPWLRKSHLRAAGCSISRRSSSIA